MRHIVEVADVQTVTRFETDPIELGHKSASIWEHPKKWAER